MTETKETKVTLDTDLKTITTATLETHQRQLWERSAECDKERNRREALPWVWEAEEESVTQIRKALNKPATRGVLNPKPWEQPTSPLNTYIAGDRVTHQDKTWVAIGKGTITTTPGVEDSVQGPMWRHEPTPKKEEEREEENTPEVA